MSIKDLIKALAEHDITATEAEVKAQLGDVSQVDESDIPEIVALWEPNITASGKLSKSKAKPEQAGSIAKLDTNNLPEVMSLSNAQVSELIVQIEEMDRDGQPLNDDVLGFLMDLYDRRKQAIEFVRSAAASFQAQEAELAKAEAQLSNTLNGSVQSLQSFNNLVSEIGKGGARLGDNFRRNTQQWKSATDRFNAHVATQPGSEVESAA